MRATLTLLAIMASQAAAFAIIWFGLRAAFPQATDDGIGFVTVYAYTFTIFPATLGFMSWRDSRRD